MRRNLFGFLALAHVVTGLVSNCGLCRETAPLGPELRHTYLVRFSERPLALFDGPDGRARALVPQFAQIPATTTRNGRRRLDVHSREATTYIAYLAKQQTNHLADLAKTLGHPLAPLRSMRHALNAVALELSETEAQAVAIVDGVHGVDRETFYPYTTDIGPSFIGASATWWNIVGADSKLTRRAD